MHVHVDCPCGQGYEFEVEPVDGRMPCGINCPKCGADGTELSNAVIAANLSSAPVAAAPAAPQDPGRLRLQRSEPSTQPPAGPPPAAPPLPPPARPLGAAAATTAVHSGGPEPSLPLGILGGVIAAGLGMGGWYLLTTATEHEFGIMAWLVGVITGLGVKLLARSGAPTLGIVAAVCAALAVLGGDFMVANAAVNKLASSLFSDTGETVYAARMTAAQTGVKADTDEQIKAWLEKNGDLDGAATAEDINSFREKERPKLQEFLDGKPSKADFIKEVNSKMREFNSFSLKFQVFKSSIGLFTVLWLVLGIRSAYRIASR